MELMDRWLQGDLGPQLRIWSALAPAILLTGYLVGALALFAILNLIRGKIPTDEETSKRGAGPLLGFWIRHYFMWATRPIWNLVLWTRIPASSITMLSMLLAAGSGVAAGAGKFAIAGWLYIFAGVCDIFDGRVARYRNEASPKGAALDSFVDRYSEAFVFIGLAWYYQGTWVMLAALAAMAGSFMVSYSRASGSGLGVDVRIGNMQRPERITYLGAGMALSPVLEAIIDPLNPHPWHVLAVVAIVFVMVGSNLTALRRLAYVRKRLQGPEGEIAVERPRRGQPGPAAGGIGGWTMFSRSILSSLVATLLDFVAVTLLVTGLAFLPWAATFFGCLVGGVTNFGINRVWAFPGSRGTVRGQGLRYSVVSLSSAFLNAGGVALLLFAPNMDYRLAWLLARFAVYVAWNYPLNRDYVFPPLVRASR